MASENLPADPQFRSGGDMVYFMQGIMAFFQGEVEESAELMSQAIAINPDRALLYTIRGSVYLSLGELDLALTDTERAIALDPDDPSAYAMQASVQWMSGDLEATLDAYGQVIELGPDNWLGYFGQAVIYFEMDDLSSSLAAWERVEELDPNNELIPVHRGLVHEKLGQSEQAAADYAKAGAAGTSANFLSQFLQIATGSGSRMPLPLYFQLTECIADDLLGRSERAFARCDEAIKADPTYFDALWKRGQLYAAQGDWESAVVDYTAAIEVDPRWPWVYYLRARALAELGRSDEAQADLARALELDPVDELRQQIESFDAELTD
jgi:tetratricopeptide (TPR) repeat protein